MCRRPAGVLASLVAAVLLVGCGGEPSAQPGPVESSTASATATRTAREPSPSQSPTTDATPPSESLAPSPRPKPKPGTYPPSWLGERILPRTEAGYGQIRPTPPALRNRRFTLPDRLPSLPGEGFASRITSPAPQRVLDRSTWAPGCPVGADELAWIRLTFWGFDDHRHTGELLVNRSAARDLVQVFADLYEQRFPIEEMRITRKDEQTAPPTGDGNDTGVFNCRPVTGATSYSQHAYGLAVDVNPFQNPYTKGDLVLPELASAYLDRGRNAPGTIHAGDPVVRAFARIGWGWGGSWNSLKDYQHFSANGR
jgi:hypothetical protein